jgi:hypothetical protein
VSDNNIDRAAVALEQAGYCRPGILVGMKRHTCQVSSKFVCRPRRCGSFIFELERSVNYESPLGLALINRELVTRPILNLDIPRPAGVPRPVPPN